MDFNKDVQELLEDYFLKDLQPKLVSSNFSSINDPSDKSRSQLFRPLVDLEEVELLNKLDTGQAIPLKLKRSDDSVAGLISILISSFLIKDLIVPRNCSIGRLKHFVSSKLSKCIPLPEGKLFRW